MQISSLEAQPPSLLIDRQERHFNLCEEAVSAAGPESRGRDTPQPLLHNETSPVGAAYKPPASSLLVPRPPASATSRQAAAIDEPFEMILDSVAVGAGQNRGLSHRHPPMIEDDAQ